MEVQLFSCPPILKSERQATIGLLRRAVNAFLRGDRFNSYVVHQFVITKVDYRIKIRSIYKLKSISIKRNFVNPPQIDAVRIAKKEILAIYGKNIMSGASRPAFSGIL